MPVFLDGLPRLALERGFGESKMAMLLVAGIVVLAAGLLAIVSGIPVKEFSLGNTLILAGTIAASAGILLMGMSLVVRELQNIVRLAGGSRARAAPDVAAAAASQAASGGRESAATPLPAPSSGEDAAVPDRARVDAGPEAAPAPAPAKPRRNLLFSSSRRERADARTPDQPATVAAVAPPPPPVKEAAPATFDDAWPQSDRARAEPGLRRTRTPPTSTEQAAGAAPERPASAARSEEPAGHGEEAPPVTVLKSGVVDGMAYSLYSDGSIEAQMPEGMMRFASIDELRSHLDHRP